MGTIIGYRYDAALHCPDCTAADFRNDYLTEDQTYPGEFGLDAHRLPMLMVDRKGNLVHPVFAADSTCDDDCDRCRTNVRTGEVPALGPQKAPA